ncbi:MAG: DUF2341 domain-containing protein [Chloroflexota bacterium]|nr:DUF2341 domain-containing protein [Chloroflexota bacterium]
MKLTRVFGKKRGQWAFTLPEILAGLAITALVIPALASATHQVMNVPQDISAKVSVSQDMSHATEWITRDANNSQTFTLVQDDGDGDYKHCYGVFQACTEQQTSVVRYSWDENNKTLMREETNVGTGDTRKHVVAAGVLQYEDVSFTPYNDYVETHIKLTHNNKHKSATKELTFQTSLISASSGWGYRIPIFLKNGGNDSLTEFQVPVNLGANFNFHNAHDQGHDIRFRNEVTGTELSHWIQHWSSPASPTQFAYELPIELTGSTTDLLDYPIKIDIQDPIIRSHIALDGSDLRFYASRPDIAYETNGLSYWIEEATTDRLAVWIKIPSIPTTGTTIYMYYGNPWASEISDKGETFTFWDDFESDTGWTYEETTGIPSGHYEVDEWHSQTTSYEIESPSRESVRAGQYGQIYRDIYVSDTTPLQISVWNKGFNDGGSRSEVYMKVIADNTDVWSTNLPGGGGTVKWGQRIGTAYTPQSTDVRIKLQLLYNFSTHGDLAARHVWWDDILIRKVATPEPQVVSISASNENHNVPIISAKVWVKVDSIPAGTSTIYMYYGNKGETDQSSVSGTFDSAIFTDSFENATLIDTTDSSNMEAVKGEAKLAQIIGGYPTNGILYSVPIPIGLSSLFAVGYQLSWSDTKPQGTDILYQVEYSNDAGITWQLVPDDRLPGNSLGFDSCPIDISTLIPDYYQIRLVAAFSTTNTSITASIQDWSLDYYSRKHAGIQDEEIYSKTFSVDAAVYDRSCSVKDATDFESLNRITGCDLNKIKYRDWVAYRTVFNPQHIFRFDIDTPPNQIDELRITWAGGTGLFPTFSGLRIWNHSTGEWDKLANVWIWGLCTTRSVTKSISNNITEYVDCNGYVYVTAYNKVQLGIDKLYTDYAALGITYKQTHIGISSYAGVETAPEECR